MKQRLFFCSVLAVSASVLLTAAAVKADVKLPEIFDSNMVLQQEMDVPVWGWADPGEKVSVSFAGQTVDAAADNSGKWSLKLKPLKADAKPAVFTVKGKNEIKLKNVLVGEVWICSGQSNMEWTMSRSAEYQEALKTVNNPNIRLFHVVKTAKGEQQERLIVQSSWKQSSEESIPAFSAVGYYFGRKIQKELNVPVGLINSSWGGTRIEPWTASEGFQAVPSLKSLADEIAAKDPKNEYHKELVAKTLTEYRNWVNATEKSLAALEPVVPPPAFPQQLQPYTSPGQPTTLYNGMIYPFVPLAVRGAVWYQGEANMSEGMVYAEKMKALILGWRKVFNNPDLGFYYVQLAPYVYGGDPTRLAELWEAQSSVEKALPKTGQAIINDQVSNIRDIHPPKKVPVGDRLALLALNRTYGKTDVVCASPEFDRLEIDGKTAAVSFKNAKSLKTRDGKSPDWFEIAGAGGVYHKADAVMDGLTIKLTHPAVEKPFAVRYAWNQVAEPNVQNEAGLQLGAFRAGEIPERGTFDTVVSDGKKYQLVYSFDPTKPQLSNDKLSFVYKTDKSGQITGTIKRVGYFLSLKPKNGKPQWVFVTMPPLDKDVKKLGVPVKSIGKRFQQQVKDVEVQSNVPAVAAGKFADGFNVEFWDCNYANSNAVNVPGASNETHDFGDEISPQSPGYGSMQIHNFAKKQTVLAFNNFSAGSACDTGIGNCPTGNNPDWTFSKSAQTYDGGQFIIFVETE
ncbi:MAG: sialate O-acetylesterase [Planctomycetaceae bacterium]|jgi:sialate O-acetylesterase|nr:sialate O-acetylesterase [Planctomycetaceae bacterium]